MERSATTPRRVGRRPLRAVLGTDLPVLVLLALAVVTVPVGGVHTLVGVLLGVVIGWHLLTRRPQLRRLLDVRRAGGTRVVLVRVAGWSLLALTLAMVGTGVARWLGVPRPTAWHGGASWLLLGIVLVHLWCVRHRLLGRRRGASRRRRGAALSRSGRRPGGRSRAPRRWGRPRR